VHRITQEIPRRAPVFGYGPLTLYGAAFQKLHLTFALPRRAPTTPPPLQNLRLDRINGIHWIRIQRGGLFLKILTIL
jgi:hypothetical protein